MRILLLCSAFNGLSQRAWIELRARRPRGDGRARRRRAEAMVSAVRLFEPDLIICPFLRERVPAEVWRSPSDDHHPPRTEGRPWAVVAGLGDHRRRAALGRHRAAGRRGDGRRSDLGDPDVPARRPTAPRKSSLYNGPVADAAIELVREVVAKAADPAFVPEPLDDRRPDVIGRLRPAMRARPTASSPGPTPPTTIVRRIRAADGSPGVRTTLCGVPVSVFDAHPGPARRRRAGHRRCGAVTTRCSSAPVTAASGSARSALADRRREAAGGSSPSATSLDRRAATASRRSTAAGRRWATREISYRRDGDVGVLQLRLLQRRDVDRAVPAADRGAAPRHRPGHPGAGARAAATCSRNGIHLNVIEAAPSPALEAWRNINAIDDVCREIITCTGQLVVTRGRAATPAPAA